MLRYVQRNGAEGHFERPEDMPEPLYRLLIRRGIQSEEAAQAFLHPSDRDFHDPFLLSAMDESVKIIRQVLKDNQTICIYGDYDVDGVCASAILHEWFMAQNAHVRVYLPSRHNEGYGLNENAIREIAQWADLMITVDCGVTSVELVALAKSLGLEVIVTDHHQIAQTLPDCPVVNPLLNEYPFPRLCGAGVAWKLVWALDGRNAAMEYVDIAALATVADVVSLTGENRTIVHMGLEKINARPRLGVAELIAVSGLREKRITSTMLGFQLGPRLNAGGRLGSAMRSFDLITARDPEKAHLLATQLEEENTHRRSIEQAMVEQAEAQLENFDFPAHRALILAGKDWNPGVIGLAASRLVEKYHYPVIMLSDQGDHMTGSCRSIDGVDIYAALCACADHLVRFGGHKQAAGLTLNPEKLEDFRQAMDDYLFENIPKDIYIPVKEYDLEIDFPDITPGLVSALDHLQPTGMGNPQPIFRATAQVVESRTVGADGAHLKLMLSQNGRRINAIAFRAGAQKERIADETDVLFSPGINRYMGRSEVQLEVRSIADSNIFARIRSKIDEEALLQCNFLTEMLYNKKINRYSEEVYPLADDALVQWLQADPQGTLILAGDFSEALEILKMLPSDNIDLSIAALPEDPRAFNTLCVYPAMGKIRNYRRVVLAGVADECIPEGPFKVYARTQKARWHESLPDIDMMREVWKALGRVFSRPVSFYTLRQLTHLIGADTGMDALAITASLLAIDDMGLIDLDLSKDPIAIQKCDRKKANPDDSIVWRTLQRWRNA